MISSAEPFYYVYIFQNLLYMKMYTILMYNLKTGYISQERRIVGAVVQTEHEEGEEWVQRSSNNTFVAFIFFLSLFSDGSPTIAYRLYSDVRCSSLRLRAEC